MTESFVRDLRLIFLSFIFIVTTDEVHNKINFSCEIVIVEGNVGPFTTTLATHRYGQLKYQKLIWHSCIIVISKIQLVVYYQCYILIG